MSIFWSFWISVIVFGMIVGCVWLLWVVCKGQIIDIEIDCIIGYFFDGIEEYDNLLFKWWFYLFLVICVFFFGYLVFYLGLGNFQGILGWFLVN